MNSNTDKPSPSLQCADAIEISLYIERKGIKFYERALESASAPRVKEIFTRLAQEEQDHKLSLQTKSQFLQPALRGKGIAKKPLDPEIESFVNEQIFKEGFFEAIGGGKIENDRQAIEIGIESEKQSIKIFKKLLELEKKMEVRAVFVHLLAEETRHLEILQAAKKECFGR